MGALGCAYLLHPHPFTAIHTFTVQAWTQAYLQARASHVCHRHRMLGLTGKGVSFHVARWRSYL